MHNACTKGEIRANAQPKIIIIKKESKKTDITDIPIYKHIQISECGQNIQYRLTEVSKCINNIIENAVPGLLFCDI